MLLEDFRQRVDLTRRIREVLAGSSSCGRTTELRELTGNANDAVASRVRLCLDHRAQGARSPLPLALAQWQSPALLTHIDAAFTDDDFPSISRINGSNKASLAWKSASDN